MVKTVKPVVGKLCDENPMLFSVLLHSGIEWNLPQEIRNTILNAGIDESIYMFMERGIMKGNFSAIYLDDRVVGDDPRRVKAKKRLDQIRSTCFRLKNEGWSLAAILTESA